MQNNKLEGKKKSCLEFSILFKIIKRQYLIFLVSFLIIFIISLIIGLTKPKFFRITITFKPSVYKNVIDNGIINQQEFAGLIEDFPQSFSHSGIENKELTEIKDIELLYFRSTYEKKIKEIYFLVNDTLHKNILVSRFINYLTNKVVSVGLRDKKINENTSSDIKKFIAIDNLSSSGPEALSLPGRLIVTSVFGILSALMITLIFDKVRIK